MDYDGRSVIASVTLLVQPPMIRTLKTAEALQALLPRAARRGIDSVKLELGLLPATEKHFESTINASLRSCGCEISALIVAVGLTTAIALVLLRSGPIRWPTAQEFGWSAATLLGLALGGKAIGLAIAEYRLRQAIRQAIQALNRRGVSAPTIP